MHMFEWNPEYSVGIASIDSQHQALFRMAAELYTAMSSGQGKTALARILERLVQYTAAHFAHEERLMRLCDYPGFAEHQKQHEALTSQVMQFQADFLSGRTAMSVQVMQFLRNWLDSHIRGRDRLYVPAMAARAVA